MSKYFKIVVIALFTLTIVSCSDNNSSSSEAIKEYYEQYKKDSVTIDKFLDTNYMTVDPTTLDVTFARIPVGGTQTSIRNQTQYPLEFKMVKNRDNDGVEFEYKVYYIKFREGNGKRPSQVDSTYVAYRGTRIYEKAEEILPSTDPKTYNYYTEDLFFDNGLIWFDLNGPSLAVNGLADIIPFFKTGTYDTSGSPNPVSFNDFGAGVVFVPSGLSYYNQSTGSIPAYSNLIFSIKLYELRYRDHDLDGVLSKDEISSDGSLNDYDSYFKFDTDGDGVINLYDIDDDGDHVKTKYEIHKDANGNIIFEDCDNDGIPNYLDKDCK